MAYTFGSLVFTPVIKTLQERYGSRRQYAKREASGFSLDGLGVPATEFLAECDSFYMASVGATGWPYVQHRGGPKGFLKVIDEHTIAFADFSGNKQFVSTGNLMTDDRVALILVDYPRQARLKILGRVKILEGTEAKEWVVKLSDKEYEAGVERVFIIHVGGVRLELPAAHHSAVHRRANSRSPGPHRKANAGFTAGKRIGSITQRIRQIVPGAPSGDMIDTDAPVHGVLFFRCSLL